MTATDTTPAQRLAELRESGARQLTREQLAHVLGVKLNSLDQARIRAARGEGRAGELLKPDGYLGRTPFWKVSKIAKLLDLRAESWSRWPASRSAENLHGSAERV